MNSKNAWPPPVLRLLRGKRTQSELGDQIGVQKNTVWRWEAGYATPDAGHARRLSQLACRERFLSDWKLAGSLKLRGDLETASQEIGREINKSIARALRRL